MKRDRSMTPGSLIRPKLNRNVTVWTSVRRHEHDGSVHMMSGIIKDVKLKGLSIVIVVDKNPCAIMLWSTSLNQLVWSWSQDLVEL